MLRRFTYSTSVHLGSKRLLIGAILAACTAGLVISGCGLSEPQSPQWSVDLRIPIASRLVDGPYLAAHSGSQYIRWHADSGLVFDIRAALDTVFVGDRLNTSPEPRVGTYTFSTLRIGDGTPLTTTIALSDLTPLTAGDIPASSIDIVESLPSSDDIDTLADASGVVQIEATNNLGLAVDSVTIQLRSPGLALALASVTLPGTIPDGESRTGTGYLSHVSTNGLWDIALHFHTPGGTILSAADKSLSVSVTFPEGIEAGFARARVDALTQTYTDSLNISPNHQLVGANIDHGEVVVVWTNNTPLPVTVSWVSSDLLRDAAPLSGEITLGPSESATQQLALDSMTFQNSGKPSYAHLDAVVQSPGSGNEFVEVGSSSGVSYNFSWSPITLTSATGTLAPTTIPTGALSAMVDWQNGLEYAGLAAWDLSVNLASALKIPASVTGQITTSTGLSFPLEIIIPAAMETPLTVRVPVSNGGQPLHPLPIEIGFSGNVSFGDGSTESHVQAHDFICATIGISAPAHIYVDSVALAVDPTLIELGSEDFGDRTGRLQSGVITVTLDNRFPLGGEFVLRLAEDSGSLAQSPALVFGPSTITAATTDGEGYAVSSTQTILTYSLDAAEISLFEHERLWCAELVTLIGPPNGAPSRISPGDQLLWRAEARIAVKIDSEVAE